MRGRVVWGVSVVDSPMTPSRTPPRSMMVVAVIPGGAPAPKMAISFYKDRAALTSGWAKSNTALDIALQYNKEEAAAYLRDKLGARRAADLAQPSKPPKSAAKIPAAKI